MKTNFTKMANEFRITEGYNPPDIHVYLQSISDCLENVRPNTKLEQRRLALARENVRNLRREIRRITLEIHNLKESEK